jgi:hypothetical protein
MLALGYGDFHQPGNPLGVPAFHRKARQRVNQRLRFSTK